MTNKQKVTSNEQKLTSNGRKVLLPNYYRQIDGKMMSMQQLGINETEVAIKDAFNRNTLGSQKNSFEPNTDAL